MHATARKFNYAPCIVSQRGFRLCTRIVPYAYAAHGAARPGSAARAGGTEKSRYTEKQYFFVHEKFSVISDFFRGSVYVFPDQSSYEKKHPCAKKKRQFAFDTIPAWLAGLSGGRMKNMRLILASVSPRRRELLRQCGIDCGIQSAETEETVRAGETPEETALRLAREKALGVLRSLKGSDAWILAADTVVADGSAVLGKPRDVEQAREYLLRLRGREHRVITGVCLLLAPAEKELAALELTTVRMRDYSPREAEEYLASGDGMDKAGAYAIQNPAFHPVESLGGCYTNVVGLPLCRVYDLLARAGAEPARPLPEGCRAGGACGFDERKFPRPGKARRRASF